MSPIFLLSPAGFVDGFVQILSKDYAEPRRYIKFNMIIAAYKIGEFNRSKPGSNTQIVWFVGGGVPEQFNLINQILDWLMETATVGCPTIGTVADFFE